MRILVVDDVISIREALVKFLSQLGHELFAACDGKDALEVLSRQNIHLVLTDILMPRMSGHQLLKRIKESNDLKDIVVVLFTGHSDIKSAVEAMREGAYDYLLKPVNIKELALTIKRINEYLVLKEENRLLSSNFERQVRKATKDVKKELIEIKKAFAREMGASDIGIFSKSFRDVIKTAKKLHNNPDIPVLIEGETGTGKEIVARYIHYGEGEVTSPFVAINCAAITPSLFESELFGYEAGAFTGGKGMGQKGKLELAGEGTIFLDEITEIPTEYQAKLLRVIEEREYFRVGGLKNLHTNARFICASNQDIKRLRIIGSQ